VKINNRESTISETLQLFLSTISSTLHDARKYALIVGGFVELLQRELAGPLNEEQRELGNRFSLIIPLLAPATRALPHQEAVQHVRNQQLGWTSISDSLSARVFASR